MSKPGLITLDTTNTFQNWLDSTNDVINLLKTDVMTASVLGDETVGNATLVGSFSANTINATQTLKFGFAESLQSVSDPVVFRSPITANTSGATTITHSSAAGPRNIFTNSTTTWQIGFESSSNSDFVITTGSGAPRFKVNSSGNVAANSFTGAFFNGSLTGNVTGNVTGNLTGNVTGNITGTANNATNLDGQPASFYRSATNLNAGTLPVARLSGTYNISISGTANNATNLNGQAASFYTNIPARLGYTPVNRAGDSMTGSLSVVGTVASTSPGFGYSRLIPGGAEGQPGAVEFRLSDNTRTGYVGWREGHFSQLYNTLIGENGYSWLSRASGGSNFGRTNASLTLLNTDVSGILMLNTNGVKASIYTPSDQGGSIWFTSADNNIADFIVYNNGDIASRGNVITASPSLNDHATTKQYVDSNFAPIPTNAGVPGQWTLWISNILPAGGTWAYQILGYSGGTPVQAAAGVAAGGSNVVSTVGVAQFIGFVWRIQ